MYDDPPPLTKPTSDTAPSSRPCSSGARPSRSSIRFTNRFKGRTANLPKHRAVLTAIEARDPQAAKAAMSELIEDVTALIADAERQA